MANLENITLREVDKISAKDLADIPHDIQAGHLDKIVEKVNSKKAKAYDINLEGSIIGVLIVEIYGKDFLVLALKSFRKIDYFKNVQPLVYGLASANNCTQIVFKTVRSGLIALALKNNFRISNVEMRMSLP